MGCEIDFRILSVSDTGFNKAEEMVMREKVQWSAAFAANGLIYSSDLLDAVMAALDLIMGALL